MVSADLLPGFFFWLMIMTVKLLMNEGNCFLFAFTAQDSVVSDSGKTFWKDVKGKPSDKFHGLQGHGFAFALITIIFVSESHHLIRTA